MSSKDGMGPLPPGWDSKFDPRTGRFYFINHYTKSTSWEDPRVRYQQIGKPTSTSTASSSTVSSVATVINKENIKVAKAPIPARRTSLEHTTASKSSAGIASSVSSNEPLEHIPLKDSNRSRTPGSPLTTSASHHHVYGGGTSSAGAGTGIQASPLPLQRLQLEESYNGTGGSPMSPPRSTMIRRESHVLADISENELLDTDEALQTISAMFPTVSESHIKELLTKYHGSQAVVISALQVAKHPFITPGPATVNTPPPTRHSTLPGVSQGNLANMAITGSLPHYYSGAAGAASSSNGAPQATPAPSVISSGYPTPRPGSAASGFDNSFSMGSPQIGGHGTGTNLFRSFPRPHSSPKMKLRYLKSVFPTVEEYLLLDVLGNSDNNVQKAADRLVKMGYVKRDTPSAPRLHARRKEEERLAEKRTPLPKPPPIKTEKEKDELRRKMKDKYEVKYDIPERILYMALESVLYDEDQANGLIMAMIEDDIKRKKAKEAEKAKEMKERKKSPKPTRKVIESQTRHTSPKHEPKKPTGHGKKTWSSKTNIAPDIPTITRATSTDEADNAYKSDNAGRARGPNPNLRRGPNDDLLLTDYVTWRGPDPEIRKGPNPQLRRGCLGSGAKGPNPSLRQGPVEGRAKGSIYNHLQQQPAEVMVSM